jgi:hypothetical protein
MKHHVAGKVGCFFPVLDFLRGNPIRGWKDDRPEVGRGPVKLKRDMEIFQSGVFDADNLATDFSGASGITQNKRLSDMQVGFDLEQATVSIDDLGLRL